jgi:antitoxin CptB
VSESGRSGLARERAKTVPGDGISWRCRRGLLELDLLLGGFWTAHRATLHPQEAAAFQRLLGLSDMDIVDRLQGRVPPDDPAMARLVRCLQHFREAP